MIDIVELQPDLADIIETHLENLRSASNTDAPQAAAELSRFLRATAISSFLVEFDIDRFHHELIRSGLARAWMLEKLPESLRQSSRYCRASFIAPLADALASGRFDIAARIAAATPSQWNPRYEYEEDFRWGRFLCDLVTNETADILTAHLDRMEDVTQGTPWGRLDVGRALLEQDNGTFASAFESMLAERTNELEQEERSNACDDVAFATGRYVCIEGLAILRLAVRAGIATHREYQYCPAETRNPLRTPFTDESWPAL